MGEDIIGADVDGVGHSTGPITLHRTTARTTPSSSMATVCCQMTQQWPSTVTSSRMWLEAALLQEEVGMTVQSKLLALPELCLHLQLPSFSELTFGNQRSNKFRFILNHAK